MTGKLPDTCLDQIFRAARTHNAWREKDISDSLLHELVELVKLGPTSANCSPARFLFVKSREAKQRLKPLLSDGNRDKTMKAPVCTIVGYDLDFYHHLPKLPVLIDSNGGRVHEALAFGRLARAKDLDVVVSGTAFTACAPARSRSSPSGSRPCSTCRPTASAWCSWALRRSKRRPWSRCHCRERPQWIRTARALPAR